MDTCRKGAFCVFLPEDGRALARSDKTPKKKRGGKAGKPAGQRLGEQRAFDRRGDGVGGVGDLGPGLMEQCQVDWQATIDVWVEHGVRMYLQNLVDECRRGTSCDCGVQWQPIVVVDGLQVGE